MSIPLELPRLRNLVKVSEIVDLCLTLLRIPSPPCQEHEIAAKVAETMKRIGLCDVTVDGLSNVYGMFDSGQPGDTLLLMSHTDAPPSGAILPKVVDGSQVGRKEEVVTGDGAVAPKGQLSAMLIAAKALIEAGAIERGKLLVAGCVRDTTANHDGVRYLLKENGLAPDIAIVGEPTDNKILLGSRGRFEIEVIATGQPSHAGSPEKAVNPLYSIAELLVKTRKLDLPRHPGVGSATLTPIDIQCVSVRPNTPRSVSTVFDRRVVPGESEITVLQSIQALCSGLEERDPKLKFEIVPRKTMLPYIIDQQDKLVQRLHKPYIAVRNCELEFVYSRSFSTDTAFLQNEKIASLAFGPGRIEDFATDHVEVSKLLEGTLLYSAAAVALLHEGI